MKKSTLISILLIVVGFTFEYLHYYSNNTFFDVKFFLTGVFCIIAGVIGLWVTAGVPAIKNYMENNNSEIPK
ncbi:MAG: hypothetical protein AB8F74_00600 [Saprospiraceae bacterium]